MWWIGLYNIEKVLPNNIHLVRKIDTNKTQVLHCKQMRQFTHHQPLLYIPFMPEKWKLDSEVSLKPMIYTPDQSSLNMKRQFPTPKTIIQRHPTHPKSAYILIYQPRKHGTHQELHMSVPEKIFPERMNYVT